MAHWIATINALDALNNPVALYFADKSYKDSQGIHYVPRMNQPAVINISANDGGLLSVLGSSSIGEISLSNVDGGLNYLADYALDGRDCTLQLVNDDGVITTWFKGIVTRLYQRGNDMNLTLKTLTESLDTPLNQARYAGTGSVEGLTTDIYGNVKPRVYGKVFNATPVLCFASSGVYQVSDLDSCTVSAVYDKGVALTLGVTRASLADLLANNPTGGTFDRFQGYFRLGTMSVQQITCDAQDTAYLTGDVFKKICDTITFSSGKRAIGEKPTLINNATHEYQLSNSTTCQIDDVFSDGVKFKFNCVSYASLAALRAATIENGFYGSFQGLFIVKPFLDSQYPYGEIPLGAVTCNATDSGVTYATTYAVETNPQAVIDLNAAGEIGLYVNSEAKVRELLDKIVLSVGGFWWFGDSANNESYNSNQINAALYQEPKAIADIELKPFRVEGSTISRSATGIGQNGLPVYSVLAKYAKIQTVQTDVLGATTQARKSRVAQEHLIQESADLAVKSRHPQALRIEFDSLLNLQTDAQAVTDRLLAYFKKRCDVVELTYFFKDLPRLNVGMTARLTYPRLNYQNTNFVIVGHEINVQRKRVAIKLIGFKNE